MTRRPRSTSQARGDEAALPQLLTPDDLAAWLGTTRRAVYARLDRGQFREELAAEVVSSERS